MYARYHKPIWLTEFALANFGGSPQTPSRKQQAAFLTAATAMLQRLSYVQRYAWFGLQATPTDGSMGLFRSGPGRHHGRPRLRGGRLSGQGGSARPACPDRPVS